MAQIQYKFNKNDEYYTPAYAVKPLLKYLPPHSNIWCPFDMAESQFVQVLDKAGHNVIHSHISMGLDFFESEPPFGTEYVISNPPYSIKTEVFQRLYDIGKPFAMLINFQGIFDNKARFDMFEKHGCEMMWLSPRVSYIRLDRSNGSVPFQSGYLCYKMLPSQLVFERINKKEDVFG